MWQDANAVPRGACAARHPRRADHPMKSISIAFAVFWQQLTTFNQCISSANTLAAQQQCLNQVHKSVNNEISRLGARG